MSDELNTPDTGTESVESQAPDNAEDWNYYDPDEDQDTEVAQEPAATEDGAEEPEPAEPTEAAHDHVVTMLDGTKAPVSEVLKGYQRQADYTRKSQEVATQRKAVEANLQRIEGIQDAFITHLSSMVPQEPSPALALSNPNSYTAQKAQYEAAMAQVRTLIEMGQQPKQIRDAMTAETKADLIATENAALADRFPQVTTKQGREKFFTEAAEAATEMGFSMAELGQVTDHRMFAMAHFAKVGMAAITAKAAAQAKVATAAPVTPRKPGQTMGQTRNPDAMKKLSRSGSMRDALKVDWV